MKSGIFGIMLCMAQLLYVPALYADESVVVSSENKNTKVVLRLKEAVLLPVGPGFQLHVEGWKEHGRISVYAVGPKGEQVPIVAAEQNKTVSPYGIAIFSAPYELRGLYFGLWILLVAGDSGAHTIIIRIPRVMPPEGDQANGKLDYGKK